LSSAATGETRRFQPFAGRRLVLLKSTLSGRAGLLQRAAGGSEIRTLGPPREGLRERANTGSTMPFVSFGLSLAGSIRVFGLSSFRG
jgi:hypothetical protein